MADTHHSYHRSQAETLLEEAADPADHGVSALHAHIALAQVHATLALADEIRATIDKLAETVRDA